MANNKRTIFDLYRKIERFSTFSVCIKMKQLSTFRLSISKPIYIKKKKKTTTTTATNKCTTNKGSGRSYFTAIYLK